jgi:hypothetical protein
MSLFLSASCQTKPEVVYVPVAPEDDVEHILAPLPAYPSDIDFENFSKEEYRRNFELMQGYCEALEEWIITEHPDILLD